MARVRLPSRMQRLLSSDEAPPEVKAFIDKVIKCPLHDIAIALSGFHWEYNKGNFHHWRPLFMHFDTYFKKRISSRKDLLLSDNFCDDDGPFPKNAVLQILRVMQIILENCQNNSSFGGLENFKLLLSSTDPEILIASLETLYALVKISPSKLQESGRLIGCGSINSCLLSLAQGWGSKEEGLGLYSCIVTNERIHDEGLSLFPTDIPDECKECQHRLDSTLCFEFRAISARTNSSKLCVVQIPDMHFRREDDLLLLKQCVEQFNVPQEVRFSLLTRIRFARAFRSPRTCRLYSQICLLAFTVLVQSHDAHVEVVSFFANEPEYTNELIRIVQSENAVLGTIKTLAVLALGAQLAVYSLSHDHALILSGSGIISAGGNRMVLLNVLQKAVLSLGHPCDPSFVAFVEALLEFYLLHVISLSNSYASIRASGMIRTLLPLLQDTNFAHMHLVCFAVKTLQKLMDDSCAAVSLFKDLGGVELLAHRLQIEVRRVIGLGCANDNSMAMGDFSSYDGDQLCFQKRLIKALLKALGAATFAPPHSSRSQSSHDNAFPCSLLLIFRNAERFGGDIYSSAVTVMSEIIHEDPTCYSALHELGIPDAFLSSVMAGLLPFSKALACVPGGLGAICLNEKGIEAVQESMALWFLVDIFTTRKYVVAMNGVVPLANAVEEFLRHISLFRSVFVDIIIEIIDKITSIGDSCSRSLGKVDGSTAMDTDSEEKENKGCGSQVRMCPAADGISSEQFIQLCIYHVMVLVHRTMENSEICRLFVEKKGIDALLKLVLQPGITDLSEGMSITLQSTIILKGLIQHHSAPLAQAFCSSLRDHLTKALTGFSSFSGSILLHPRTTPDIKIFSPLFSVECLLFLTVIKDTPWVHALLTEFGNGSKDVLKDIGRVHREVLWQIALNDVATAKMEGDGSRSMNEYPLLGSDDPQLHHADFSDAAGSFNKMKKDKKKSYYSSCCDMLRSLSVHISHMFLELGKVMLLPSRHQDDSELSSYSKSVVSMFSSIALDHMNFGGHVDPSTSETSISTKCRYFGKIIDFLNDIIMYTPETCNPILLNCFYCHGVLQEVLTTFEATHQLHFMVNRAPASPMETDDEDLKQDEREEIDHLWIYGPLDSFGILMDHLVTSSLVLSPSMKNWLAKPLMNGNVPFPQDAERFVKALQAMVLKAVVPIWTHPHFIDSHYEVIKTVISILGHIYIGVGVKKANSNTGARITGPPPNESTISTIVEMGFSRSGAEEALRQVGTNSVEMGMEWTEEDDELAQALAMSLEKSGTATKENVTNAGNLEPEEETVQLPHVDVLLSTCTRLLLMNELLAFPVRDLLVMLCSQDDGQYRFKVVSFIIDHMKLCSSLSDSGHNTMLSALFHLLALVLDEDVMTREIAFKNGLVKLVLDLLSRWDSGSHDGEKPQVPKWLTAAFLSIDRLLQVDPNLNFEILKQLKKDNVSSKPKSIIIDEGKQSNLRFSSCYINLHEQKKLIETACRCIMNHLPPEVMHVILQVCATLTRTHSVAIHFLETGGLPSLLSFPMSSLFPGFDKIATNIIHHIFEDPQTLQQLMESEIRHGLLAATQRHSGGRLTPQNFLKNMASVIYRDPVIFVQAAQSVCQIEMVGEIPYIVLFKEHKKNKCTENGKEVEKFAEKDRQQIMDGKIILGDMNSTATGNGHGKLLDSNSKTEKFYQKPPQSFVCVIELLLNSLLKFVPYSQDDAVINGVIDAQSLLDLDVDVFTKEKGKAVACVSKERETNAQRVSLSLARTMFILKLLPKILLRYPSSVHVLLQKDTEVSSLRGGIFHHILHKFLPYSGNYKKETKFKGDWRQKLATRASKFLVASCTCSTVARRRVFTTISNVFNDFFYLSCGFRPPDSNIHAFIDMLNDVLFAPSPTRSYVSAEASATFVDVGLVQTLTRTLQILDLDHTESPKVVTRIIKALELVTKEHVQSASLNSRKGENLAKLPFGQNQPLGTENFGHLVDDEEDDDISGDDGDENDEERNHQEEDDMSEDVDDEERATLGPEEGINGINVFDRAEVVEGGSQLHTTSMMETSTLHIPTSRQSENAGGTLLQRLEELLLSMLRRSTPEKSAHSQSVGMQCERNDAIMQDIEAVSQETGGSGATLGESLRSLEVEIGSADGGERQTFEDRMPSGDLQSTRTRRANVALGNALQVNTRDVSLCCVSEVSENPRQEVNRSRPNEEEQNHREADSGSIDPAFLDALTAELHAEVLSAQQDQVALNSDAQPQNPGDIDPEFLAALPPDIREEVLAQQQAQRLNQSRELQGQPIETDTVSIIATFPPDLREEVLLTSSDAILANLTPALVAEANMLRERHAHRHHHRNRTIFGTYPRNRRGETSRQGEGGISLDRTGGTIAARRSLGGKIFEVDGSPLVDTEALKALTRLFRVVQPLYKGQLQKLLLNLCAHHETRTALVQILMDMLMLNIRKPVNFSNGAVEPSYRLYTCQSYIMYSSSQSLDEVPPMVSRRILETLIYLAQKHPHVAKLLLHLELVLPPEQESEISNQARGNAMMFAEDKSSGRNHHQKGDFSIVILLTLLSKPLYLRSIAHLEQLLYLLEVVIDNAGTNSSLSNNSGVSLIEQSMPQNSNLDAEINSVTGVSTSVSDVKSSKTDECPKPSSSNANSQCDTHAVLLSLPHGQLRLLCSLLGREGLSDSTYVLVGDVLKKLVAIAPTYCHLFITELADSVKKLTKFAMDELRIFGEVDKELFSTMSTNGTLILRVLQALSFLVASLREKDKDCHVLPERERTDTRSEVRGINATLEPLWLQLSSCINKLESYSDSAPDMSTASRTPISTSVGVIPPLPMGSQNILPYVKSFFLTCEKLHGQSGASYDFGVVATSYIEDATTSAGQQKTSGSIVKVDDEHNAFVKFSEKHRMLLNSFIRKNPGLLEKSFSLMLKVPRFIDFDNKRAHFRSKIKHQHDYHRSRLRISVRRAYILEDSYNQLRMRSTEELKGRLAVHFHGEEGIDAGGLTREWYYSLSRVIFDKGALLFTTVGNESTFQPNPNSVYQTEHLSYFKFIGLVVGKALFDGKLLDVHFTRSFYKHILGVKVTFHDIEAIDPDFFKNLKWMLENDISDGLDVAFSMDADEEKLILYGRAEVTDYELIPGGRNIRVNEENKHKYVDLVAEHRLTTAIRPQINSFLEGFNELIPRDQISIFNDKELELLINGLPDIDLDDMRENTEYSGYSAASPVIQWFWEVVQGFSEEDKAHLLQFVTGTSKVPLEGFNALQGISGSQRFQIHKTYDSPAHLPSAHTCSNQLDLPEYPSKQHLEERLLLAIHEANEGFSFR